jgi:RNA polymerase sigma-70 factor (ECF subfamily)
MVDFSAAGPDQELEKYREYLHLLARLQLGARLQAKIDLSGLVQLTLLEAHRAFPRLRTLADPDKALWLRRALAGNLRDELRKLATQKRDVGREVALEQAIQQSSARLQAWLAADQPDPCEHLVRQEETLRLVAALTRLPDSQRRAVEMHHLQGLSVAEVAAEMGCTKPAVLGYLKRGVRKLRELLT